MKRFIADLGLTLASVSTQNSQCVALPRSTFVRALRLNSLVFLAYLFSTFLLVSPVRGQDNNCDHDYICEKDPKRIALVIGNSNYTNLASIPSAMADAEMMRHRLVELGFDVDFHLDVRTVFQSEQDVLPSFRQKLTTGDFIVFYFSGHGFSYGADNFIAPTEL